MRQIVLVLILVLFGSAPVWAGGSNPDQLNVDSTFYSESPKSASSNTAYIRNSGNRNSADGQVSNFVYEVEGAIVWWDLYSPDKVSRKHSKGNQSQKSYVEVGFTTWDATGTTWDSTIVEKCSASAKVKGSDGIPETAKWKAKCTGALEAMGLSTKSSIRLAALLGEYVNVQKDKISISGKGPVD